jgi:hypothetical protein
MNINMNINDVWTWKPDTNIEMNLDKYITSFGKITECHNFVELAAAL